MNIWQKVGLILVDIVLIGVIITCCFYIGNNCDKREADCTIWSMNGNCKIRYNDPNYTTVCAYDSECNPDKDITIKCYFDTKERLDIKCPTTSCRGADGAEVFAILGLVFSLSIAIFTLVLPCFSAIYSCRN